MNYPELIFSVERVKRVIRVVKDLLRGKQEAASAEDLPALADAPFASLKADVATAKRAADSLPGDAAAEMKLAMAAATYRDTRYANAGRVQLGRLAINNRIRGAFECSKIAKDHNIK